MEDYKRYIESTAYGDIFLSNKINELEIKFDFFYSINLYYFYDNKLYFIYNKPHNFFYVNSDIWFGLSYEHEKSRKMCKKLIKKYFGIDARPELPTVTQMKHAENVFNG
ncbi:hypothetical protein M0Q50_02570 [bacterium]|jgi:hypothetical protein|nr:hypothetical protein [bacterium]